MTPIRRQDGEVRDPGRSVPTGASRRGSTRFVDTATAVAFLTPGMLAFIVFAVLPALIGLGLSFVDWDLFGTPRFVGLENFERLAADPDLWHSLYVTTMFVVLGVIPTTVIGFCLAVVANSGVRGASAFRILYFLPMVASSAVASAIWINIYQPDSGLLNSMLALVGVEGPRWLVDPAFARPALVIMMIWSALPIVIILYLAGLQRISPDIYAAASLDGAGRWRQLWSMTWPGVAGTTAIVLILQLIGFLGGALETALIMTGGGPLGETTSLALYAYEMAFDRHDIGYASAISVFQLLILAAVFLLQRLVVWIRRSRS